MDEDDDDDDEDNPEGAMAGGLVGDHSSQSDPVPHIPEGVDWFANLQNQVWGMFLRGLLLFGKTKNNNLFHLDCG